MYNKGMGKLIGILGFYVLLILAIIYFFRVVIPDVTEDDLGDRYEYGTTY
jgi:hypothetical protein